MVTKRALRHFNIKVKLLPKISAQKLGLSRSLNEMFRKDTMNSIPGHVSDSII